MGYNGPAPGTPLPRGSVIGAIFGALILLLFVALLVFGAIAYSTAPPEPVESHTRFYQGRQLVQTWQTRGTVKSHWGYWEFDTNQGTKYISKDSGTIVVDD